MEEISISEIKNRCERYISNQKIIVSGFCDYGNLGRKSKNIRYYQYVQLISFDGDEKISVLDDDKSLLDGVFYKLEVAVYFKKHSNEIALKKIKILEEDKNNLIYNHEHFSVLKNRLKKGTININEYLSLLFENNKIIKIGMVTPKESVAINDIMNSLSNSNNNLKIEILKEHIITIENFLSSTRFDEAKIDFWLITRGGGDLSLFNSYNMIKKISELKKPVVTALGHSTDYTLTDFMADRVFSTPTSIAEYLNSFFRKEESRNEEMKKLEQKLFEQSKKMRTLMIQMNDQEKELEKYKTEENHLNKIIRILNTESSIKNNSISPSIKKFIYIVIVLNIVSIIINIVNVFSKIGLINK